MPHSRASAGTQEICNFRQRPSIMQLHNRRELRPRRKSLRNSATSAEAVLWTYLKNRQLDGRKFRRQHSIGPYIADFYCPSERLIIELDGAYHFTSAGRERDRKRDQYLQNKGIKVLRFENRVVFEHPMMLLEEVRRQFGLPPSSDKED